MMIGSRPRRCGKGHGEIAKDLSDRREKEREREENHILSAGLMQNITVIVYSVIVLSYGDFVTIAQNFLKCNTSCEADPNNREQSKVWKWPA